MSDQPGIVWGAAEVLAAYLQHHGIDSYRFDFKGKGRAYALWHEPLFRESVSGVLPWDTETGGGWDNQELRCDGIQFRCVRRDATWQIHAQRVRVVIEEYVETETAEDCGSAVDIRHTSIVRYHPNGTGWVRMRWGGLVSRHGLRLVS